MRGSTTDIYNRGNKHRKKRDKRNRWRKPRNRRKSNTRTQDTNKAVRELDFPKNKGYLTSVLRKLRSCWPEGKNRTPSSN